MNALAGWGFATPDALDRFLRGEELTAEKYAPPNKNCYVSPEQFEAYAATLTNTPTPKEVQAHFQCTRPSAYNYHRKVVAIIARRAREGA